MEKFGVGGNKEPPELEGAGASGELLAGNLNDC